MSSLSQGPYNYNRFEAIDQHYRAEEQYYMQKLHEKKSGSKPDYLDFDKDGNKDEPMKKALKEKGKDKDTKKEEVEQFVELLVQEGYDLSEYTMEEMAEIYESIEVEESTIEEDIVAYLIEKGYANNEVSADIVMKSASYEWLNHIANELSEGPAHANTVKTLQDKVNAMNASQSGSANRSSYGKQSPAAALYKAHLRGRV